MVYKKDTVKLNLITKYSFKKIHTTYKVEWTEYG